MVLCVTIIYNHANLTNFGISVASVPTPVADHGQIWPARVSTRSTFTTQVSSGSVYCFVSSAEKPKIWLCFHIQHSAVAPPIAEETQLEAGAQLQTFPYPTISKAFP